MKFGDFPNPFTSACEHHFVPPPFVGEVFPLGLMLSRFHHLDAPSFFPIKGFD